MKGMKRFMPVMLFMVSVSVPSTRPHPAPGPYGCSPCRGHPLLSEMLVCAHQPNTSPPTRPGMKNV